MYRFMYGVYYYFVLIVCFFVILLTTSIRINFFNDKDAKKCNILKVMGLIEL